MIYSNDSFSRKQFRDTQDAIRNDYHASGSIHGGGGLREMTDSAYARTRQPFRDQSERATRRPQSLRSSQLTIIDDRLSSHPARSIMTEVEFASNPFSASRS
jgi:hypothetical protein